MSAMTSLKMQRDRVAEAATATASVRRSSCLSSQETAPVQGQSQAGRGQRKAVGFTKLTRLSHCPSHKPPSPLSSPTVTIIAC